MKHINPSSSSAVLFSRSLPCITLAVAVVSLRGISFFTISLALFALLQSFKYLQETGGRTDKSAIVTWILFAASAFYGSDNTGISLLYISIFIVILSSADLKLRLLHLLPLITLYLTGTLSGVIPLIAGTALAVMFTRTVLRIGIFTAGCIVGVVISGIPSASHYEPVFPEYEVKYERFDWHDSICVNMSHPEIIFEVPDRFASGKRLYIQLRTGGVRNNRPVGIITFDGISDTLSIGIDTLEFTPDVHRITVSLLREWQPFNHPVIWIGRIWQD